MELPNDLFSILRSGVPALLLTVDEGGFPHTTFTYAAARAKDTVVFVVDEGSATLKNISRTQKASLQILATGNCVYLLKGSTHVEEPKLKNSPAPAHRAVMELATVKSQAWTQIQVAPLVYEYSERAGDWANALLSLFAELRGE